MKQVLIKRGGVIVDEVPAPEVGRRNILVRVSRSCISAGTEMAGVRNSGHSLYRRVLNQPEKLQQTLQMIREQGVQRTARFVAGKQDATTPTGYSAAGEVIAIGAEVNGFSVGDLVACAGAGIANHAEVIDVPVNLAVRVPVGLTADAASTVTLGAIAMQGVRRTVPTLGETVVVVGLGIIGQITAQLLHASGCRVIGVDVDPARICLALENKLDVGVDPATENFVERVHKLTDGFGADAVIVTAATTSHQVISEAMKACRKKGRVVLVGDVGLNLNREDLYSKELDFLISSSYGPGRHDAAYEVDGNDYPLPYVRWTENRNMEAYLQLVAAGKVSLANLFSTPYPVDEAAAAYTALKSEGKKPLLVLLAYPERENALERKVMVNGGRGRVKSKAIRVALVGAGGFAQSTHLPNIEQLKHRYQLHAVMSRTGSNAKAVATRYGASYATTAYDEVLSDPDVDLVMLATRHNLHGELVLRALQAGKNVFVEKPLAITESALRAIAAFYSDRNEAPLLMTGFNRRFAPAMQRAKTVLASRATPLIVSYRMNAGYVPSDSWIHGEEGGGRNVGEACHIYDLFNFLTGGTVAGVHADGVVPRGRQWARNDNFVATVTYVDGSVCSLAYTAMGDTSHPKERMDIYADGKVLSVDDYRSLEIAGARHEGWTSRTAQKGHLEELQAVADCLLEGRPWPISLEEQLQAMTIAFDVERQIDGRARPPLEPSRPPAEI